jgi:hypothetical protein
MKFRIAETVGKVMRNVIYLHKNYENQLPQKELAFAKSKLPKDYDYTAVKYDKESGAFSFIQSPDFDTADEPTVGMSIKVTPEGKITTTPQASDPLIWHHKWQWVGNDYKGFGIEASKLRSKEWQGVVNKDREILSRIGRKSYWDKNIIPQLKGK